MGSGRRVKSPEKGNAHVTAAKGTDFAQPRQAAPALQFVRMCPSGFRKCPFKCPLMCPLASVSSNELWSGNERTMHAAKRRARYRCMTRFPTSSQSLFFQDKRDSKGSYDYGQSRQQNSSRSICCDHAPGACSCEAAVRQSSKRQWRNSMKLASPRLNDGALPGPPVLERTITRIRNSEMALHA